MKSPHPAAGTAEWRRLQEVPRGRAPWRHWGPYLSERGWGTVREDYSADADAWGFFPFDHARSRAYRWNEDGLGGICDDRQTLCFAFAFWNGADPFLKERIFGLDGHQGNHGEDAKEYWWYLDSTPTHSWMRWRYMYPQARFPYEGLVEENARRGPPGSRVRAGRHRGLRRPGGTSRSPPTTPRRARRTSWSSSRCATWGRRRPTSTCCPPSGSATPGRGTRATTCRRSAPRAGACGRHTTSWAAAGSTACPAPSRSSATTRPTRAASGVAPGPPTPRTASTTTWSPAHPRSIRGGGAPRPRSGTG